MTQNNICIFCRIIEGKLPATIVADYEDILVIKDINPRAPVHYLIIPKHHIGNVAELIAHDKQIAARLLEVAHEVARGDDFRLIINNGPRVGQSVFHFHYHLLAGKQFSDF